MRTLLALASVTLLVAGSFGCGDDTTTTTAGDMAMKAPDMSMPHDMMTLTCAQTITCEFNCTDSACQTACIAEASSNAKQLIGLLGLCLYGVCSPDAGNANGSCTSMTDTSQSCAMCIKAAGTAASMGGACNTQFMNCASM